MKINNESKIVESWEQNASPWIKAIEEHQVESRRRVTDKAIVDTVLGLNVDSVLDIGCGEGWLVRELSRRGLSVDGLDAIKSLVDRARQLHDGHYKVLDYRDISPQSIGKKYNAAVCNFSLIGKESVEHIFEVAPAILATGGSLVVQTLHPIASCGEHACVDGWREGSWEGFSEEFCNPAPWYFRTLESWKSLFKDNGFKIKHISEPLNAGSQNPVSLIMVGALLE